MADVSVNRAEGDVDKVVQQRFFRNQNAGIFVDVGAANPDYLSVSALYRSLGWKIIAIDPNPVFCEMHRKRGHDVLQYACGDRDEDEVDFCVVDSHGAPYENGQVSYESFSSLAIKESYARIRPQLDVERIKVKLRRLDTILQTHAPEVQRIDIAGREWHELLDPLHDFGQRAPHGLIDARLVPVVAVNKLLRVRVAKLNQAACVLIEPGVATDQLQRHLAFRQIGRRPLDHECGRERLAAEADDRS
jgi:FkbM family methyltransferase